MNREAELNPSKTSIFYQNNQHLPSSHAASASSNMEMSCADLALVCKLDENIGENNETPAAAAAAAAEKKKSANEIKTDNHQEKSKLGNEK